MTYEILMSTVLKKMHELRKKGFKPKYVGMGTNCFYILGGNPNQRHLSGQFLGLNVVIDDRFGGEIIVGI